MESNELRAKWENTDPNIMRTGTSCKCGAHTSAYWQNGGEEWLIAHVAAEHAEAFDWPGAIRKALAMEHGAREYLTLLVEHHEKKVGLA